MGLGRVGTEVGRLGGVIQVFSFRFWIYFISFISHLKCILENTNKQQNKDFCGTQIVMVIVHQQNTFLFWVHMPHCANAHNVHVFPFKWAF